MTDLNWQLILDIAIVALALIIIIKNAKDGFVKTFLQNLKGIIVILLALALTPLTVDIARDNFVTGWFEGTITTPFVEAAEQAGENFNYDIIYENLPESAYGVISMIDVDGALSSFEKGGVEFAQEFGTRLETLVINIVSNVITYVALMIVLSIVLTILFKIIEKFVKLPVLKQGDHILGFIWGIVSAYVEISVLMAIIPLLTGIEFIEGTYVARFIYENGLFSSLIEAIL